MVSPAKYAQSILDTPIYKVEELLYPFLNEQTYFRSSTLAGKYLDKYAKVPPTSYLYGQVYNSLVRKVMWVLKRWAERGLIEIYTKKSSRILYKIKEKEVKAHD